MFNYFHIAGLLKIIPKIGWFSMDSPYLKQTDFSENVFKHAEKGRISMEFGRVLLGLWQFQFIKSSS